MRTNVLTHCLAGFLAAAAVAGTTPATAAAQTLRRVHAPAMQARREADDVSMVGESQMAVCDSIRSPRRCFPAGRFTVTVMNVDHVLFGYSHTLRLDLQFRNVGRTPITLAYRARTGKAADNLGNAYITSDAAVSGIPTDFGGRTDPRFQLFPGEARTATFEVEGLRTGKRPSWFNYDLTIDELGPGKPAPVLREHAIFFSDVAPVLAATGESARRTDSSAIKEY
jgi:hypothetical protein